MNPLSGIYHKPLFSALVLPAILAVVVMGVSAASYASADKEQHVVAKSNIVAATVYSNRAEVTRRAVVDLPAGAQKVVFDDLPIILFPDSLRAKGSAKADVTFGALSHKRVNSLDLVKEKEKELTEKLQTLQDKVTYIQAEQQALQAKKEFLDNLGKQARLRSDEEIAKLSLNTGEWQSASDTIYGGIVEIETKKTELNIKTREINKEMQLVRNELGQIRTGQRSALQVTIPVDVAAPTRLTVELVYQVPNATWKPLYDARLSTKGTGDLELVQYGSVRQSTGEDWGDIALKLSTAQPQRGASLPNLTTKWVNVWEPGRRAPMASGLAMKKSQNFAAGAAALYEDEAREMDAMAEVAAAPMERQVNFQAATIETGGFVSEYKIAGPSDVKSDGTETKLLVGAFETESELQIHVRPQISTEAFLVAETVLKGEAPILPGQVNLFRDGAYVGQSYIAMLRPGEDYSLFFGVDDQVSVKRNILIDERKDAGVIARDNTLERHYVTEIKNLHKDAVKLVVQDTVPVAQNEKIEVKFITDNTTSGYAKDVDDVKGLLEWDIDLAAGAGTKVNLGWKVSWPKDHSISGL